MKTRIFFLMTLLASSLLSNAQLYLGAKVGLNFANLNASIANTAFNKKIGINGGATIKYNFTNTLGAQMDLAFSQMGSIAKEVTVVDDGAGTITTTTKETTYDYSYLQIPVYVNFEIPIKTENLVPYRLTESMASFHLQGGFFFGYGLGNNATTTEKASAVDDLGNTTITVAPKVSGADITFNPIDVGLAIGAGFSFKLSDRGRLTVDGRYIMGFMPVNTSLLSPLFSASNRAPQIQLGYIHRISRLKRWQVL